MTTEVVPYEQRIGALSRKARWQREHRRAFAQEHGYSETAHYGTDGQRAAILKRDEYACVICGMTDRQHKAKWNRPITIDHKDKNRSNNAIDNLQTLCLTCHGRKDLSPHLRSQKVPFYKQLILAKRHAGETYQQIADELGFSIGAIWKWINKWNKESA